MPGESAIPANHSILFICLGNICRSPLAWAIFRHHAARRGVLSEFEVESCGTGGWHAGEGADPRSIAIAARRGVPMEHTARQLDPESDFARFSLLIPMDRANRRDIIRLGADAARVRLMRSFDPTSPGDEAPDVPDPYYGGEDGFDTVFEMLDRACAGLLDEVLRTRA